MTQVVLQASKNRYGINNFESCDIFEQGSHLNSFTFLQSSLWDDYR